MTARSRSREMASVTRSSLAPNDIDELISAELAGIGLYYWSKEAGVLELLRSIAALPEEARAALEAFFAMAHEPSSVVADWDASARLTLASPQVDQAMGVMRHPVGDYAEHPPRSMGRSSPGSDWTSEDDKALGWAIQSLGRTADCAGEAVVERRERLRELAKRQRTIDRKQAETTRMLGRLVNGMSGHGP